MVQATKLIFICIMLMKADYEKDVICTIYIKLTTKCSHRLYYVTIVVDFNLILLIFLLLGM